MPMDASYHISNVVHHRDMPTPSRPTPSRSQTQAQTPTRPTSQGEGSNEIDFGIPDVRPGLAKLGRRLTEMSENFLYDENRPSSESKRASTSSRASLDMAAKVPFMGDEPVFCPFCNKPLPPALLLQHMTAAADEMDKAEKNGVVKPIQNPRLSGASSGMVKTSSAPEGSNKSIAGAAIKPDLQKKPSGLSASRPASPTSSAQLEKPVKEADSVDLAASKVPVDVETLRKWARIAGIQLELPEPEEAEGTKPETSVPATKPFPKIGPPPGDQSRSSSRNSSRFNLFGSKSKGKRDEDEEDSDDDDLGGPGGYARLDGPASPEREEQELPSLSRRSTERPRTETVDTTEAEETKQAEEPKQASEEEVRSLLKEVLTKINEMSKSHSAVLHSHSTLLTTLKIARSNLAMAEANAEMLEEQVKRYSAAPKAAPPPATTPRTPASTSMGPPPVPMSKPMPTRTATTGPGAGEGSIAKAEPSVSRRSAETTRPQSIQIPQSTNPRSPMSATVSASSDAGKGMFGSFWNRNKDKVGDFMNSLPDLTPMAEKSSFDFAKSPTSPAGAYGTALPDQYRSPGLNRSKTVHGRAGEADSLPRSSSYTNVQAAAVTPSTPAAPSDPFTRELTRLRQLYQSSQSKMEAMTKELADLKKGKVEMEAELENLSQALFEEANKMVAEERKRRAELEESLKEVKEEREALRETIKVLGGQVETKSNSSMGDPNEETDDLGELPEFQPRDLDKHYEALRKSIHHVADGAVNDWAGTEAEQEKEAPKTPGESGGSEVFKTPSQPRRHSLPDISSPEPQRAPALHDPWADPAPSASRATTSSSPTRSRRQPQALAMTEDIGPKDTGLGLDTSNPGPKHAASGSAASDSGTPTSTSLAEKKGDVSPKAEKLDRLDKMMEEMQADVVLDSPLKEKSNPFN